MVDELQPFSPSILVALAEIDLPVYILDAWGIIRWENAACLELFGDRAGEQFTAPVAPEAHGVAEENFARKVVGGRRTTSYEAAFIAADGRRFDAEVETVRLDRGGQVIGVFGILSAERFRPVDDLTEHPLTPRQFQVLRLLARGYSTQGIMAELHIAESTARNHVRDLLSALGVHSRVQAVARAHELGLL